MTDWQPQRVAANGISLNIYRAGSGPALVLLHGVTDSGLCWLPTANELVDEYDVILIDARGHGDSDKPRRGYTPEDHAADVAGVIEALELDRPIVIGHSMGAQTAATFAANYPALVRALVLEDPPWFDGTQTDEEHEAGRQNMINWLEGLRLLTQQEIIAQQRLAAPEWPEEVLPHWAVSKLAVSMNIMGDFASIRRAWQSTVPDIQCPVLLITADRDRGALVAWETAAEIAQYEHVQTVHIPGAGHNIRREQYAAYQAALRTFVDEVVLN